MMRDVLFRSHCIVQLGQARQPALARIHGHPGLVAPFPAQIVRHQLEERQDIVRSEEHTSELQSLMRISYAVFCLKKKKNTQSTTPMVTYSHIKKYKRQQKIRHIQLA